MIITLIFKNTGKFEQGKYYCRYIDGTKNTRIIKYMSRVDETKGCCYCCIQTAVL